MKLYQYLKLTISLLSAFFLATSLGSSASSAGKADQYPNFLPMGGMDRAITAIPFDSIVIDGWMAGDIKLVGDVDGDGQPDLVVGGMKDSEPLTWYRYPGWEKSVIANAVVEFTTDGEMGDVDGDGDLDIVTPDGNWGENLVWLENPRPGGDPGGGTLWERHTIGGIGDWGKDVELADYDGNGRLDVAVRSAGSAMIYFQDGANSFQQMSFSGLSLGYEGMGRGDVDGDGDLDLVLRGVWLRNPGGSAARVAVNWTEHAIGEADQEFKAWVADVNGDGQQDVLFSSSENTADVNWWTPVGSDPTGAWEKHTIVAALEKAHTLQAADMDGDGDLDVVLGQMHTSAAREVMVWQNVDGQGTSWQKQVVASDGLHNGVVADIGQDGDQDIFGANWTGNPPVRLYENRQDENGQPGSWSWSYKQVSSSHQQTFGLAFGDVDGDGETDIVSGQYWYHNPGGDLQGEWEQHELPEGLHATVTLDVDGDELLDIIAQKDEWDIALYWLEGLEVSADQWQAVKIGTVERASHALGAQGYRAAQVEAGGRQEVIITSGKGLYYFNVPASNAQAGNWERVHVSSNPSDEGLAVGDIDGDGDLDIAATTGETLRVEWYRNPGDGSGEWTAYTIANIPDTVYPDRTELADLNGDGRLDIVTTEENGLDSGAESYWWEAPADPTSPNWTAHRIVSQATTNSLDVADMDGDGDVDVVLAEHRGAEKLAVWMNDGKGTLSEQVVSTGRESHLGARAVDLDQDGDLDLVSIAWDDFQFLHLWRNDSDQEPVVYKYFLYLPVFVAQQ